MSAIKVLFLAAEADPFIKIGGLGDVAGSLPRALHNLYPPTQKDTGSSQIEQVDVRLVIPFHGAIQRQDYSLRNLTSFTMDHPDGPIYSEAITTEIDGLPVYLIAGSPVPPDSPVYSDEPEVDGYKYTFFSIASLELMRRLEWSVDILHANDWHTAPSIYAMNLWDDPFYRNTATLLGLHNLPFMGSGAESAMGDFGLPPSTDPTLPWWARHLPLTLGLLSADHIVAVSPNYAKEILTPEFGCGLEEFLKTREESISGILNGIDVGQWDPSVDTALASNYTRGKLARRTSNKSALLEELGLDPDLRVPLLAMVSRMDPQKGIDLVPDALRQIADLPWNAIILGTGIPALETMVRQLETEFPDRIRAAIRFDTLLSHRIYAGADILLIPSRYEPSGLTQMIAMRYGCVPVARATGGLSDTIDDDSSSKLPTGFLFQQANSKELAQAISRALEAHQDASAWGRMQKRGMSRDFSWEKSAREYYALYESLIEIKHKPTGLEG